jgi:hypothetical protein
MMDTIRELFVYDVTRNIPPVVYFHEQTPDKLAAEVSEYIVTGGWPETHPNHRRVPNGIHEQYVRLLSRITAELERPGGPDLPASWISGFYGSGKSIFAKLLGLSLDGKTLADGTPLARAWLARDTSPRTAELRAAWEALVARVQPIAVVFDIGGVARDREPIHAAALRQLQRRLGYCSTQPLVAEFELKLERDGLFERFAATAQQTLGRPWAEVKDNAMAEEDFSHVLHVLYPERYTDPTAWFLSRAGTLAAADSPEETARAIQDMLRFRAPGKTLFFVIDEVSQYIHQDAGRMLGLQSFVSEVGQRLKGRVWLLVTGQEKLEETSDAVVLGKMKDRFPQKLRVHLNATNIRDVVHKRLLQKTHAAEDALRALYRRHQNDLRLFAFGGQPTAGAPGHTEITEEDFVETYPLLPGHIDLLLQITSALRLRSSRSQGDDQAIRGLLQLLGELFRDRGLALRPTGTLVTLDEIYEVQATALDSDVQASMARILAHCAGAGAADALRVRAAKAVALLELIQETLPTDAALVAAALYDRVDRGSTLPAVTEALESLRRENLLGYSEKHGYKIQSSAGEEWERERREIGIPRERISELVKDALDYLVADARQPELKGRPFPWAARFSDGRLLDDVPLKAPRDQAAVLVDLRFLPRREQEARDWVVRSAEKAFEHRLLWVCGDAEQSETLVREWGRSLAMVRKYKPRRDSLNPARMLLLSQEEVRADDLRTRVYAAVGAAWMAGQLYFRGQPLTPTELGAAFAPALEGAGQRVLPKLYPHFVATNVTPSELLTLVEPDIAAPPPKFLDGELGILERDAGRFVPACSGAVPRRVLEFVEAERGTSGAALLAWFGGPPYGYAPNVVRAAAAGLLRAGKLQIQTGAAELSAVRDAGVREVFERDKDFRQASFFPLVDEVGPQARARICQFFQQVFAHPMDREDQAIADAVGTYFPDRSKCLRDVLQRLNQLPGGGPPTPAPLEHLQRALEDALRNVRQTRPTVRMVKKHLDALREGLTTLAVHDAELTDDAIRRVRDAARVRDYEAAQLAAAAASPDAAPANAAPVAAAAQRIQAHLASERPWRDVAALDADVETVRDAYRAARERLLAWQEEQCEAARARVKARKGFETLNGDQSHQVLRPIAQAGANTTADAVAPALDALRDPFLAALRRAEEQANERLDELLVEKDDERHRKVVVKVDLRLRGRELETETDLQALLAEVRQRIEPQLGKGTRVRLV